MLDRVVPGALALGVMALAGPLEMASADTLVPMGTPPSYAEDRDVTAVFPNAAATDLLIWLPSLDQGDVAQGLTVLGRHVLVAAYQEGKEGPRDCRLHRFDADTGAHAGTADVPTACNHGGGLAVAGGRLFLSDTWTLIELDADALFDPAQRSQSVKRSLPLRFPLRGSFAAGTRDGVWIGEYRREPGASLRFVTLATIDAADPVAGLGPDSVARQVPAPARAQGGTVAPDGSLWVSASSSQFGALYRLDSTTGKVLAEYAMPVGTEDLGLDAQGRLWTVSEAGALKYLNWPAFHPFVMRLRPEQLR